jgi:hypothetical protein
VTSAAVPAGAFGADVEFREPRTLWFLAAIPIAVATDHALHALNADGRGPSRASPVFSARLASGFTDRAVKSHESKEESMNMNILLGIAAIAYGLYTIYVRFTDPSKLGKLDAMKKQWGEAAGTAIHWVSYTLAPIVVGVILLVAGLRE